MDATSFALMKKHELRAAFAFDTHFSSAGFCLLSAATLEIRSEPRPGFSDVLPKSSQRQNRSAALNSSATRLE
jgi:hypothetical protein